MLAHADFGSADVFLLVTPDRLYLWKEAGLSPVPVPPTYEADTTTEFAPYFESVGVNPGDVSGHAFELVVGAWLGDLMRSARRTGESTDALCSLIESGLCTAVKDGESDRRLKEVCSRLLRAADVIPLDASVLITSSLYQSRHGFSPQDAIVYASVLSHLDRCHERKSYFISRDLDFDDQDVIEELSRFKRETYTTLSAIPASRRIISTHSSTPVRLVSRTLSAGSGGS